MLKSVPSIKKYSNPNRPGQIKSNEADTWKQTVFFGYTGGLVPAAFGIYNL